MTDLSSYTEDFYSGIYNSSNDSSEVIVPLLMALFKPKSVIDLGCGTGIWINKFRQLGVEDILGVDGEYVDEKMLVIEKEKFIAWDLRDPFHLSRKFDLAISLEVAEHLPIDVADNLVDTLTSLSSFIVFAAAIPGQGGTDHINEQWHSYWIGKFKKRHFHPFDPIRPLIWDDSKVSYWYKQNILLFVDSGSNEGKSYVASYVPPLITYSSIVHPQTYMLALKRIEDYQRKYMALKHSRIYRISRYLERLLKNVRR